MINKVERVGQKDRKAPSIYPFEGGATATGGALRIHSQKGVDSFLLWNEQDETVTVITSMEPVKKGARKRNCILTRYSENGQTVQGKTTFTRSELNKLYDEGDGSMLDPFLSEQIPAWEKSDILELFSPDAIRSSYGSDISIEADEPNKVTDTARRELSPVLSGMVGVLRRNAENSLSGVTDLQVTPVVIDEGKTSYNIILHTESGLLKAGIVLNFLQGNISVSVQQHGQEIQIGYGCGHRLFKNQNGEPVPVDESDVALRAVAEDVFYYLEQSFPVAFLSATSERVPFEVKGTLRRLFSPLNINSTSLMATGVPRLLMTRIGKNREERYAYRNGVATIQSQNQSTYITVRETFPIEGEISSTGAIEKRSTTVIEQYIIRDGELQHWTGKAWEAVLSNLTCKRITELLDRAEEAKEAQIKMVNGLFGRVALDPESKWLQYQPSDLRRNQLPAPEEIWTL